MVKRGKHDLSYDLDFGKVVTLIEFLKNDWVFGCKSDRVVLMPNGWMSLSEWAKTLPKDKFKATNVWY